MVDDAVSRLQLWCAKLLNRGGRTILVQTTLCAIPVHIMMSLDIPPKTMQALLKICGGFMWKARHDVKRGHSLVAWDKVASPKCNGGLGLPNLHLMNLALRCRWAWAEFNLQLARESLPSFEYATVVVLGNGKRALFWKDWWLNGVRVLDLTPKLVAKVAPRRANARTVKDGLAGEWLRDCGPDLG
jgi:hypothetical protein